MCRYLKLPPGVLTTRTLLDLVLYLRERSVRECLHSFDDARVLWARGRDRHSLGGKLDLAETYGLRRLYVNLLEAIFAVVDESLLVVICRDVGVVKFSKSRARVWDLPICHWLAKRMALGSYTRRF